MENKITLPSLQDLYNDTALAKKETELNVLLNQEPNQKWLKLHPIAKNVKYIPIERIEYLLTRIFGVWNVEIKSVQLIANSILVIVKLWYKDPITGNMLYQDGIGAAPLQTDKDAGAIEFDKIKSDAVMKAAPAAESFAVKDAAEKIGKLFGKDLNRADKIGYDTLLNAFIEKDNPISDKKYRYLSELINTSTFDEDTKCKLERELEFLTESYYENFLINLQENQKDVLDMQYSQSDFKHTKKF